MKFISVNDAANVTDSFWSSNVFKFFLSLPYLIYDVCCSQIILTEEFLACLSTPSSPQYDIVSYRLF